ncbi:MAG: hypothetical protein WCA22_11840 [Candidatus Binatus sp.]
MPANDKPAAPDSMPPANHVEPPKIYLAACGALCDIFWWARRNPPGDERDTAGKR